MSRRMSSKSFSLLRFPIRKWQDWLRISYDQTSSFTNAYLKLSFATSNWKLVKHAVAYELSLGKCIKAGNSLTRSQVHVSKKKPWRQKGTGRARSGSKASPLFKGGGVVFGPQQKASKSKTINKKTWKAAVESALYNKRGHVLVIQGPWHQINSTLPMGLSNRDHVLEQLALLGTVGKTKYLVILPNGVSSPSGPFRGSRIMPHAQIVSFNTLKCVDIIAADVVLVMI